MDRMKAFARISRENNDVKLIEVQIPSIEANEVLIKVTAFGVGLHDRYFIPKNAEFPYPIGLEGTGKIVKVGKNVSEFKANDEVIFYNSHSKGGSWAQYAVALPSSMILLPEKIDITTGATLPVAGKTALEIIREINLNHINSLFIAGASGAIGTFLIQLATKQGIRVAASASIENHDHMKSLGCEYTVDYNDPNWKINIKSWINGGVDIAIAVQPNTTIDCLDIVRDGGKIITLSGDEPIENDRHISIVQLRHKLDFQEAMHQLTQAIINNQLKVVLDKVYSFDEALMALEKAETRHARGKSVILM